ncbi:AmmeMemoRadiSam system protein B [Oligoflexia bacterium]|nr:AmmeMemoRadiSam system protein B [Oligoflexia bacterium]
MEKVRKAAVSGTFYSDNPLELKRSVQGFIGQGKVVRKFPKAVIVPHAGYIYSGKTAGVIYALLKEAVGRVRRVVLVGPAHRVAVSGIAASDHAFFETPLGRMKVDRSAVEQVLTLPYAITSDEAHQEEHCLEVQLPFLQEVFGEISIVPLLAGQLTPVQMAEVFELLNGEDTIFVVSSDLSHFLDYESALAIDTETSEAIQGLAYEELKGAQACGAIPIKGLLYFARKHGFEAELVELTNSGETTGDYNRVVGYGGYAFYEPNEQ